MNTTYTWYNTLIKPDWAPPSWLFGPVWSVLYLIIFITYGAVLYAVYKKKLSPHILVPFAFNLVSNFSFTYFQFWLKNNILATLDILLVVATLVWVFMVIHKKMRWIMLANIPYLLWVLFATVLQITITYLNF